MKTSEIENTLGLTAVCGADAPDREISGCYIGDLLSLAMSRVQANFVWITIQTNINIAAVASLTDAGCVIVCDGFSPDENTVKKAQEEGIKLFSSEKTAYELACGLAKAGI